jgi:Family of unknown function (DUF6529)
MSTASRARSPSGSASRSRTTASGRFFYGVFTIKVLSVRSQGLPDWVLPLAGGATFAALVAIWTTSSVWFWSEFGFPSF